MKSVTILFCGLIVFNFHTQILTLAKWSYVAKELSKTETIVYLRATITKKWHLYSINQKDGSRPIKASFSFIKSNDHIPVGKLSEPKPHVKYEETFHMDVHYLETTATFIRKILLSSKDVVVKGVLTLWFAMIVNACHLMMWSSVFP